MSCFTELDTVISNKSIDLHQAIQVEVSQQRYQAYLWRIYREFNNLPELQQSRLWEEWMSEGFFAFQCPADWEDPDQGYDFEEDQGLLWEYWLDTREITPSDCLDFLIWVTKKAIAEEKGTQDTVH